MVASNVSCFVPARYDTFETETEIDWWSPVVMSRCFPRRLYAVARLGLLLCLLAGAIALLIQISNSRAMMPDSDPASVVGPPTLPAATVDAIFAGVGSPMYGTGKVVEQAARQANIDDAFALGVWWVETNDGAAGVGSADHNPGSVKASGGYPVAFDGYTIYPSYSAAILDWFNVLKARYISRGLTTVYAISYPYVGTSSSPLWAGKVVALMQRYRAEAPPPTPTPLPKPLYPASHQKSKAIDQTRESAPPTVVPSAPSRQPAAAPAPLAAPALAPVTRDAILLFGLLTALALALYALALDGRLPVLSRVRPATGPAVTTEALHRPSSIATPIPVAHSAWLAAPELSPALAVTGAVGQEPVRQTDALSPLERAPARFLPLSPLAPSLGLPALNSVQVTLHSPAPATGSLRRVARVTLRPTSEPDAALEPEPVPVIASGAGLLSRYRRMQQYGDVSL